MTYVTHYTLDDAQGLHYLCQGREHLSVTCVLLTTHLKLTRGVSMMSMARAQVCDMCVTDYTSMAYSFMKSISIINSHYIIYLHGGKKECYTYTPRVYLLFFANQLGLSTLYQVPCYGKYKTYLY